MKQQLDKMIDFYEAMGVDDKGFFCLFNEKKNKICVEFTRNLDKQNWRIWDENYESTSFKKVSLKYLPDALRSFSVSLEEFQLKIIEVVLVQTCYADEFIRQVTELLGPDTVQKSLLQNQNFMTELEKTVKRIMVPQDQETQNKIDLKKKFKVVSNHKGK